MPGYIIVPALSFSVNSLAQYLSNKENVQKARVYTRKFLDQELVLEKVRNLGLKSF